MQIKYAIQSTQAKIYELDFKSTETKALFTKIERLWVECLPMVWETRVQSQVESYQRLKNDIWFRLT